MCHLRHPDCPSVVVCIPSQKCNILSFHLLTVADSPVFCMKSVRSYHNVFSMQCCLRPQYVVLSVHLCNRITLKTPINCHVFFAYCQITADIHYLIFGALFTFPCSKLPIMNVHYIVNFSCPYELSFNWTSTMAI